MYGFHDPEDGFVWSTHSFGLFFPGVGKDRGAIVFTAYNPHGDITLDCQIGDRSLAVTVPRGEQNIRLDAGCIVGFVDFAITPKILLGRDVREPGLMIRRVAWENAATPVRRRLHPRSPVTSATTVTTPDGLTRLGAAARTLGSFLREGWFKAGWFGNAFHFQLHAPSWMTHDTEIACTLTINGREKTVAFL